MKISKEIFFRSILAAGVVPLIGPGLSTRHLSIWATREKIASLPNPYPGRNICRRYSLANVIQSQAMYIMTSRGLSVEQARKVGGLVLSILYDFLELDPELNQLALEGWLKPFPTSLG